MKSVKLSCVHCGKKALQCSGVLAVIDVKGDKWCGGTWKYPLFKKYIKPNGDILYSRKKEPYQIYED